MADIIRHAEAVFIAGGNQSRYVNFWRARRWRMPSTQMSPRQAYRRHQRGTRRSGRVCVRMLERQRRRHDLASTDVLPNPYHERVTLVRDFLKIPNLENTLTDSHFAKRDRMGRTLGFLARLVQDGWSKAPREIAIDEKSAVLVEPDGQRYRGWVRSWRLFSAGHVGAGSLPAQYAADHSRHFAFTGLPPARTLISSPGRATAGRATRFPSRMVGPHQPAGQCHLLISFLETIV